MMDERTLSGYVCRAETPLMEVLKTLNALPSGSQFQVVVDEDRRVLGAITDGDIRRALLHMHTLDVEAVKIMNSGVLVGAHNDPENKARLASIQSDSPFLPIVDGAGRLIDILMHTAVAPLAEALVLAGGFGRRLGELTRDRPKPLVDVGGVPILELVLSNLERAGVRKITVAAHFLAEQIEAFVHNRDSVAAVEVLVEEKPLGTAGAIGLMPPGAELPLLVMNADLVSSVNLRGFVDYHQARDFEAHIAVRTYVQQLEFGVVRQSSPGVFAGMEEKPQESYLINAGLYILGGAVRDDVRAGEYLDMPNLLNRSHEKGRRIGVFPIHEEWIDVGRPKDLERARDQSQPK